MTVLVKGAGQVGTSLFIEGATERMPALSRLSIRGVMRRSLFWRKCDKCGHEPESQPMVFTLIKDLEAGETEIMIYPPLIPIGNHGTREDWATVDLSPANGAIIEFQISEPQGEEGARQ